MASATAIVILVSVLVGLSMFFSPSEAIRVIMETQNIPYFEGSMVESALPKDTTLQHSDARHVVHRSGDHDRILQSAPSPGYGNH